MPNEIISTLSSWIITVGAIASALIAIYKVASPLTSFGKKRAEKKKSARNEEVKQIAETAIQTNNEKFAPTFKEINTSLDSINTQLRDVVMLNAEQSRALDKLDVKVDENEVGRLRWEIISFANMLRSDDGESADNEDYEHIIEAYGRYETILQRLGRTNGFIDNEYAFICDMYRDFRKR